MGELADDQIQNNLSTRDHWNSFHEHRDRVTNLLRAGKPRPPGRLCVLGAGNCNDLDLVALLDGYHEVHLVDLDTEAMARGVARQGLESHPGIHRHGGVDLTGALDTMATWSPRAPIADVDLAACLQAPLQRVRPVLPGPFDRVASACLLSQLVGGVVRTAGEKHPRFLEAMLAVRAGHLRLLVDLVAPGGTGILINDAVSSDTFPGLASVPEEQLSDALLQLIEQRNFFHGVNPAAIGAFFQTDPVVTPQIASLEGALPWRWDLQPRLYLVYALMVHKRSGSLVP